MQSKWKGTCKTCGKTWEAGNKITKVDDHWCIDPKCVATTKNPAEEVGEQKPTPIAFSTQIHNATQITIQLDMEAKKVVYGNMSSTELEQLPQQQQKEMSIAKSVLFKGMVEIYKAIEL